MALLEDAVRFGGLVMAHAAYVASDLEDSALICPFSVVQTAGERQIVTFESDSQVESVERGKASFEKDKQTVDLWSLAREGRLSYPGTDKPKRDVITVSAWKNGLDEPVILHQCFEPKSSGSFRLIGPLVVSIHGMAPPEPAQSVLGAFAMEGIRQHPQGRLWELWLKTEIKSLIMKTETKPESDITAELKALGLKPVVRWLPDTSDPAFMERYQEQRAAIAAASQNSEIEWWEQQQTHEGWV